MLRKLFGKSTKDELPELPDRSVEGQPPPGFNLRHTLRGHKGVITRIAWSPGGRTLASPSNDKTIRLWDAETGKLRRTIKGHGAYVNTVAWSLDGRTLVSGSGDNTIRLWDGDTGVSCYTLKGHASTVTTVAWSPDGRTLASGSSDNTFRVWDADAGVLHYTLKWGERGWSNSSNVAWSPDGRTLALGSSQQEAIYLWDAETGEAYRTLEGHSGGVLSVAWSPDGQTLASASKDHTIQLWDSKTGRQMNILEGHTNEVKCVSFSFDGRLLASKSNDGTVRLWRCDTWETVVVIYEPTLNKFADLAFHPKEPVLATLGEWDTVIRIWDLDLEILLGAAPITPSVYYTNAKVVLVGDTGVGKTGLGLVLTGQPFVPTESTHGRHVWTFDSREVELEGGREETRETLLWDLAGQAGYRLIHQLHLNEVAVALVVFDARSETDPFAGVRHWDRALRQALRLQGDAALPMKKFLVAARTDRGGVAVSRARIDALVRDLGYDGYLETSAKEGWNIAELTEAIRGAIEWEVLPKVSSTELFQRIKTFLIEEKKAGWLLSTADDLYRAFLKTEDAPAETDELRAQFETCIGRVESRGLIRRLSFGDLVLLQPELLDAYASALVNAAKEEPDGLGCITEEDARVGRFRMAEEERIRDKEQEKLLLIATVEELLCHEIALREQTEAGPILVFPSQFTREWPDAPDPEGKAVIFRFDGPLLNVYATLAVRLSRSGIFTKQEMWKNAAAFNAIVGGLCGMWLREVEEGQADLTLFFDSAASEATRYQFEEYVHTHLQRRALAGTIERRRVFVCPECATPVSELAVKRRRERSFDWIRCNVCETQISLLDREERLVAVPPSAVPAMDRAADAGRELDAAVSVLQGKKETGDFDVFISYSHRNEGWVRDWLLPQLEKRGIYAYIDFLHFDVGVPVLENIEHAVERCPKTLLVLTPNWVESEWTAFEGLLLQTDDPAGLRRRMLSLMLEKCELPKRVSIFTYADFTQPIYWERELERIVNAIEDRVSLPES
jgi:GTPase SAR1 family protein/sugar lactone lactonase YvrE